MSVFPLNIPEKTNTPELLAFFQQFGLDRYLSAEEINKMTAALEELKEASTNVSVINTILVNNSFTKVGQIFKGNAGTQWNINGLNYTNSIDQEITIPLCATGKVRTDRIVLDTNNNFVRVQGVEFTANPVAQSKPVNTLDYTFIPVNDSEVGEPDTPTVGNIFNKKDYDKVYAFNASGDDVEIPFNVNGFSTIELYGSLTSVKGFSFTDLSANPTLAEWPHKGKPIYLINRSGHNIELKNNNLTAILPFNFDSGSSIIFPNNGKILLKVMTNNIIDFLKSWVESDSFTELELKADLVGGKVPAEQLPSYVDDVLEFANLAAFPLTGETAKIYLALDNNLTYRWTGSVYVKISDTGKLDKVSTVDVEKVYVKNADGTQGMKPVSEFGGGSSDIIIDIGLGLQTQISTVERVAGNNTYNNLSFLTGVTKSGSLLTGPYEMQAKRVLKTGTAKKLTYRYFPDGSDLSIILRVYAFKQNKDSTSIFDCRLLFQQTLTATSAYTIQKHEFLTASFSDSNLIDGEFLAFTCQKTTSLGNLFLYSQNLTLTY